MDVRESRAHLGVTAASLVDCEGRRGGGGGEAWPFARGGPSSSLCAPLFRYVLLQYCPRTNKPSPLHPPHKPTGQAPRRRKPFSYCGIYYVRGRSVCALSALSVGARCGQAFRIGHQKKTRQAPPHASSTSSYSTAASIPGVTNGSNQGADQAARQGALVRAFPFPLLPPFVSGGIIFTSIAWQGPQRRSTIPWQHIALPKHPSTINLCPTSHPFLGVDPPLFPSLPPTLAFSQALNKHYRKKIIRKNFGLHGDHEGKYKTYVQGEACE